MVVEILRDFRTSKDCCNGWCCEDAVYNYTVAERRGIGQNDRNNVQETDVTDLRGSARAKADTATTMQSTHPVHCVCGRISLDVVARSLHDRSHDDKQQHAEEAFDTAPNVKDLGNEEVENTARDRSNDADDGGQSMFAERRGDIWVEVGLYGGEQ